MSNDNVIEGEFSVKDEEDPAKLNGDGPSIHTVLEVWRATLEPAERDSKRRVTAGWAAKIVSTHNEVTFADMNVFRDRFYGKIAELVKILKDEIATDPDCLSYDSYEDDALYNRLHYKNLIRDWQVAILGWELAWDCEDPYAGVELAAISEVHKMFFSQTGLTAYLDNIKFEFTEDDQHELAAVLEELRAEATGE